MLDKHKRPVCHAFAPGRHAGAEAPGCHVRVGDEKEDQANGNPEAKGGNILGSPRRAFRQRALSVVVHHSTDHGGIKMCCAVLNSSLDLFNCLDFGFHTLSLS